MIAAKPIGVLGGTFDPIHFGHLRAAYEVMHHVRLQQIRFIPCQAPVHKSDTHASVAQRLTMLQLAIADQAQFIIDERELKRTTPSYMVETLTSLRNDFPTTPLCLLLGQDAFASFSSWHRWEEILQLAHLIIMNRPSYATAINGLEKTLLQQHQTNNPQELSTLLCGKIYCQTITALEISSTLIRQELKQGVNPQYLLPEKVIKYIFENKIYS